MSWQLNEFSRIQKRVRKTIPWEWEIWTNPPLEKEMSNPGSFAGSQCCEVPGWPFQEGRLGLHLLRKHQLGLARPLQHLQQPQAVRTSLDKWFEPSSKQGSNTFANGTERENSPAPRPTLRSLIYVHFAPSSLRSKMLRSIHLFPQKCCVHSLRSLRSLRSLTFIHVRLCKMK